MERMFISLKPLEGKPSFRHFDFADEAEVFTQLNDIGTEPAEVLSMLNQVPIYHADGLMYRFAMSKDCFVFLTKGLEPCVMEIINFLVARLIDKPEQTGTHDQIANYIEYAYEEPEDDLSHMLTMFRLHTMITAE